MKPHLTLNQKAVVEKALNAILRRPDTFDMRDWIQHDEGVKGRAPFCGTVACLAGHLAIAAANGLGRERYNAGDEVVRDPDGFLPKQLPAWLLRRLRGTHGTDDSYSAQQIGREILGIDGWDGALFSETGWPSPFRERYQVAVPGSKQRAQAVVDRVVHWMRTGE